MQMLSEDDRNLTDMTFEELGRAWDLWFDLAQATNEYDPAYSHGVFVAPSPFREGAADAPAHDDEPRGL